MKLYLLRHGDAVESGTEDALRPLSALGEEQAHTVAAYLRASDNIPGYILTSPLTRALQMSVIIRDLLNVPGWAPTESLVPGSDQRQLLRELGTLNAGSVLLVGHEPHLQGLASYLIRGDRLGNYPFRKSSLAGVEIGVPIEAGAGKLRWMVSVEQMKNAG